MEKYGITSVDALHRVEDRASNYELDELRMGLVQNLKIVSEWFRDHPSFDILGKFDKSLFQEILNEQDQSNEDGMDAEMTVSVCGHEVSQLLTLGFNSYLAKF